MELRRVLEGVPVISNVPAGLLDAEVRGLGYDSRKVESGYLFFAFAGARGGRGTIRECSAAEGSPRSGERSPQPGWIQRDTGCGWSMGGKLCVCFQEFL